MSQSKKQAEDGALQPLSRRGFLRYVGLLVFSALATAIGVFTPIIAYLWPPEEAASAAGGRVAVASTDELPVGKGSVYSVANKPVVVIHTADDEFVALSATCTHLGCIVFWHEQKQLLACPCHEAYFNTNGAVISGPPPGPLPTYRVQVEGDQIYVEGEAS